MADGDGVWRASQGSKDGLERNKRRIRRSNEVLMLVSRRMDKDVRSITMANAVHALRVNIKHDNLDPKRLDLPSSLMVMKRTSENPWFLG